MHVCRDKYIHVYMYIYIYTHVLVYVSINAHKCTVVASVGNVCEHSVCVGTIIWEQLFVNVVYQYLDCDYCF